jgi:hypothetical protein
MLRQVSAERVDEHVSVDKEHWRLATRSVTSHHESGAIGVVGDSASLSQIANPGSQTASSPANRESDFSGSLLPGTATTAQTFAQRHFDVASKAHSMLRCFGLNSPHQIFIESQCRLHQGEISTLTDFCHTGPKILASEASQPALYSGVTKLRNSSLARYATILAAAGEMLGIETSART